MLFAKLVFHSAAKTSLFHAHDNPFDMFWLNGATSFQRLGTRKFQGVFRAAESFSLPQLKSIRFLFHFIVPCHHFQKNSCHFPVFFNNELDLISLKLSFLIILVENNSRFLEKPGHLNMGKKVQETSFFSFIQRVPFTYGRLFGYNWEPCLVVRATILLFDLVLQCIRRGNARNRPSSFSPIIILIDCIAVIRCKSVFGLQSIY